MCVGRGEGRGGGVEGRRFSFVPTRDSDGLTIFGRQTVDMRHSLCVL